MSIHIDNFSGKVSDLAKSRRSPDEILAVLAKHSRVSVWDLDGWLWPALRGMQSDGLIKFNNEAAPYPWCHYDITESGRARLAASDSGENETDKFTNKSLPPG